MKRLSTTVVILFLLFAESFSQSNWDYAYNILQTNCTGSSCHGGSSPVAFDLGGGKHSAYAQIVNAVPLNATAKSKSNFLVDPGHPYNSFLLKKVGHGFDTWLDLEASEGNRMPSGGAPALDDTEIEIIRQWILLGADSTDTRLDTALINDFYTKNGLPAISSPAPPPADSGFQIRLGSIFLPKQGEPGSEVEYLKKVRLMMDGDKEITRIEGVMNSESHHFLLFVFDDSTAASKKAAGLRDVSLFNNAFDGDKQYLATWQYSDNIDLPQGTAFFWDDSDWLDFNYHIRNYNNDSVLQADFYMNVWTQETGSGAAEMRGALVNNTSLFLMPGANTESYTHTFSNDDRLIWWLTSHTHKYGTDFDIYKRNPDGTKGKQVYEGFFDPDYQFNQGFYDYSHPANRVFDSLLFVGKDEGLIMETDWYVTQSTPVYFGLTTADEMQLISYLYVNAGDLQASRGDVSASELPLRLYPNPAGDFIFVNHTGESKLQWTICDITGRLLGSGILTGEHGQIHTSGIPRGLHVLRITDPAGRTRSGKIILE